MMDPVVRNAVEAAVAAEQASQVPKPIPPNENAPEGPVIDFTRAIERANKKDPAPPVEAQAPPAVPTQQHVIIDDAMRSAIIQMLDKDPAVQEFFVESARKLVSSDLATRELLQKREEQNAHFKVNEEACEDFGVAKSAPQWQVKMMKFGSSFWFVIWYLVAFVTVAPVSRFDRALRTFVKAHWLSIVISALVWIAILTSVIWIPLINRMLGTTP